MLLPFLEFEFRFQRHMLAKAAAAPILYNLINTNDDVFEDG